MLYLYIRNYDFGVPYFYPGRAGSRRGQKLAWARFKPFWAKSREKYSIPTFEVLGKPREAHISPTLVRKRCIGEFKEDVL